MLTLTNGCGNSRLQESIKYEVSRQRLTENLLKWELVDMWTKLIFHAESWCNRTDERLSILIKLRLSKRALCCSCGISGIWRVREAPLLSRFPSAAPYRGFTACDSPPTEYVILMRQLYVLIWCVWQRFMQIKNTASRFASWQSSF